MQATITWGGNVERSTMGMVQLLWHQKQKHKMALLIEPMLRTSGIKGTHTGGESYGIANENNSLDRYMGRLEQAAQSLDVVNTPDVPLESSAYAFLLQECISERSLAGGKLIHAHMIGTGFSPGIFLGTKLVIMYAKCGSLLDARRVLDAMAERSVVSWTAMLAGYARYGHDEEALALFYEMQRTGIRPNQFTFASVLPACANLAALEQGKKLHEDIIRSGHCSDGFVQSALVDMYIKCGDMEDAHQVFDKMAERNIVLWTKMIVGYAQFGYVDEALKLFQRISERDAALWNAMVSGCAQNGYVAEALKLFQKMPERNVISWTGMVAGYVQNGCFKEALKLFGLMQLTGVKPNPVTWAGVLQACANMAALEYGRNVHEGLIRSGLQSDVSVQAALVDMYVKCGCIEEARQVFDKMSEQNIISCNAMIAGYEQSGQFGEALKLFWEMRERDVVSWNTVIAGYARNGRIEEALELFQKMSERSVVSWNAMIAGYGQNRQVEGALELFQKMPQRNAISWNAMIAGYAQNGYAAEALDLFQKMPKQDVISWNALIAGYAQNGHSDKALNLFQKMQLTGVKPNAFTFASVLSACANMAALEHGKEVHENITRSGFQFDAFVGDALLDMYAKCGSIQYACKVFDRMPKRNLVSWTAMIVGYATHGYGKEALQLFEQMQCCGINPDQVTFVGVLSACCHAGLVDDGWQYFHLMSTDYHITPTLEHYCCMVDLFGRSGRLNEAHDFISKMPIKPNVAIWASLLGACRMHNNIELGEHVADNLFNLDPKNAAHYVLLSNIYAASGRWDNVEKVRQLMKERGLKKKPGFSWIDVNKKAHAFLIGQRSQSQTNEIYSNLEILPGQMRAAGYGLRHELCVA